ncbi:MAG: hypothetical protein LBU04_01480 [Christensenellaceae bacterium]|jgi:hypothetical protein|nr:hypothetical protein [Christensenellaceae bacterium]
MDKEEIIGGQLKQIYNEFLACNFLVVCEPISKMLKLLSTTAELYDIVERAVKCAPFDIELSIINSKSNLILPTNPHNLISLVTGLLLSFDAKGHAISDFINRFFHADSLQKGYLEFCQTVLLKYSDALLMLLHIKPKLVDHHAREDLKIDAFPDKAKEDSAKWVISIKELVEIDNELPADIRAEYIALTKGMLRSLDYRESWLINVVWIGMKNSLISYLPAKRALYELGLLLYNYKIIG